MKNAQLLRRRPWISFEEVAWCYEQSQMGLSLALISKDL
jgi:hypothetical protein